MEGYDITIQEVPDFYGLDGGKSRWKIELNNNLSIGGDTRKDAIQGMVELLEVSLEDIKVIDKKPMTRREFFFKEN